MMDLFKGKGSILDCCDYRDITVGDAVAGHWHGWLRGKLNGPFENFASPNQFGSRAKRSTALASHTVKAWLQWCRLRSTSAGALFLDAVSAFAEVFRELLFGRPWFFACRNEEKLRKHWQDPANTKTSLVRN